jgi:hypothetical protein
MKSLILLLFITTFSIVAKSQTIVFKTKADFLNGTGIVMDSEYVKTWESSFGMAVKFKDIDGKETEWFNPKRTFAFLYKGRFFRSVGAELAMLIDTGKINFFINGFAGLGMLSHDRNHGSYLAGESSCYLSTGDMTTKIYMMPIIMHKRDYKRFKEDHPEFESFYDNLRSKGRVAGPMNYETVHDCVNRFNREQREGVQ